MKYEEYLKKAKKRREQALRLRCRGLDYSQIGERLGVTRQRAHAMVKAESMELGKLLKLAGAEVGQMEGK